jgi:hypothetical protein
MRTEVQTERTYTLGYYKMASKDSTGFTITVTGDRKLKVVKEAAELLAIAKAEAAKSDKGGLAQ